MIELKQTQLDLDAFNVSYHPRDLLGLWAWFLCAELVSHSPIRQHRDHAHFKDWVFIGKCGAYLRIEPMFKNRLYSELRFRGYTLALSTEKTAFIRGHQHVSFGVLVSCLERIGCTTVRLTAYGMKHALDTPTDIGNPEHPLACYNSFDLGHTYTSSWIILVCPATRSRLTQTWPIMLPINEGYGTVAMFMEIEQNECRVKAYSPVAHCLKAIAGNQLVRRPKTVEAARNRFKRFQNYVAIFKRMSPASFGGIRIEATITTPVLSRAMQIVETTQVLNHAHYQEPRGEHMLAYKLQFKQIAYSDYIQNCERLVKRAEELEFFVGADRAAASALARQGIVDLFNAAGWNDGRLRPSKWNMKMNWWSANFLSHPDHATVGLG